MLPQAFNPHPAILGVDDPDMPRLEHAVDREDVAHVIVDHQHFAIPEIGIFGERRTVLGHRVALSGSRRVGAGVVLGQIEGELAARTGGTVHVDPATEQSRDFPADGEAQSGATVLAIGSSVGLLECLENQLLFLVWYSDPGITDRKRNHILVWIEA